MPRRKPLSGKQRKEALQEKRAIKRGDIEKPTEPVSRRSGRGRGRGGRSQAQMRARVTSDNPDVALAAVNQAAKVENSRKLQSAFRRVSPEFLALWKEKAANDELLRPIPSQKRFFPLEMVEQVGSGDLTTPKRPKWRYEMSKKEVEANEEGIYLKWREETEAKIDNWRSRAVDNVPPLTEDENQSREREEMRKRELILRSPTFYEQNLEVWRQLWRVSEISSILLVLLDSRCPPLHYPPSLHAYLSALKPSRKIILVLTKVDILGAERVARWKTWLSARYPDAKIVGVESYRIQVGKGSRVKHMPHIPPQYLSELIDAMEQSYNELLQPPESIRDNPQKVANWQPRVRRHVDWEVVRKGEAATSASVPAVIQVDDRGYSDDDSGEDDEQKEVFGPLTVGLIGQPNVGKSSLLNALFGTIKVKASRTPGKTKHFQTLFWSPEIRLVDCPGLVLPNLVPMELQVLCAILPISQIASIPSCIHFAASLLPLEQIYRLQHPSQDELLVQDRRTWRDGMARPQPKARGWTAMDILTAYANQKGWLTAKAGRPDVNRAGNAILRGLADGRIKWAFEPPMNDAQKEDVAIGEGEGRGIWIVDGSGADNVESDEGELEESGEEDEDRDGSDNNTEGEHGEDSSDEELDEDDDENEEASVRVNVLKTSGRFGALSLMEDEEEESDG